MGNTGDCIFCRKDYQAKYFEKTHGVAKENVVTYKGDAEALSLGYKLDEGKLAGGGGQ